MSTSADPFALAGLPDPLPVDPVVAPLRATALVPGSKSITNRALVCAGLAGGVSHLRGVLRADDTDAMVGVLASLGVHISADPRTGVVSVSGCAGRVLPSSTRIDTRQSGTTSRFALPLLVLGRRDYRVTAHEQMQARPMGSTFDALRQLGAVIHEESQPDHLPATIDVSAVSGNAVTVAGDVSSQFLSGLLMVGPCLRGGLRITLTSELVSRPYVELTLAVMAAFGATVAQPDPFTFVVEPGGYQATDYDIEPDASAASYPLAAAVITGGTVTVPGLGSGALQGDAAFADVLARMGAEVDRTGSSTTVRMDGGPLRGGTFDFADISDTAQTIAVLAPFADAPVEIRGIGFIRRKEIDRIAAVTNELRRCGVSVDENDDGWTIHPGPVHGAVIETYDDHRMAMSFAILGLRVPGVSIAGPACVAKTFPGFWDMFEGLRTASGAR